MGFLHREINESLVEWLQSFQPNKKANKGYSKQHLANLITSEAIEVSM